jgi:pyruvate dehydrogenase (quinone)
VRHVFAYVGVQIDIDGKYIGMRYPNEANLVGDSAATLRALIRT